MPDNESPEMQRLRHVVTQLELEIEGLQHMKRIVPFLEKFEADLIAIREKLFDTRLDILAMRSKNPQHQMRNKIDGDPDTGTRTLETADASRAPQHGKQVPFRSALAFCRTL
jgi:hypothetical protein